MPRIQASVQQEDLQGPSLLRRGRFLPLLLLLPVSCKAASNEDPGLDPYVRDLTGVLSGIAGVIAVGGGLYAIHRDNRKSAELRGQQLQAERESKAQRERDLRWRKASLARDVLNELWDEPLAADAMLMLDWEGRYFAVPGEAEKIYITTAMVNQALRVEGLKDLKPWEVYVRDCFDSFFGAAQVVEHYIGIGLLEVEDVAFPFGYYTGKLTNKHLLPALRFLTTYDYTLALRFFGRFSPDWSAPVL